MENSTQEIIRTLCKERGLSVTELEKNLGYGNGSLTKKGSSIKSDRLFTVAKYFNVPMEYLITGEMPDVQDYYIDPEVSDLAEELRTRPELKIVFDASKDVSRKNLLMVAELLERLNEQQYGEED